MSLSEQLYLSILAMDSYNRGYDVGISIDGGFPAGATPIEESNTSESSAEVQSGFYAIAYTLGSDAPLGLAGTTVISYRGTDVINPLGNADTAAIGGDDISNGLFANAFR